MILTISVNNIALVFEVISFDKYFVPKIQIKNKINDLMIYSMFNNERFP